MRSVGEHPLLQYVLDTYVELYELEVRIRSGSTVIWRFCGTGGGRRTRSWPKHAQLPCRACLHSRRLIHRTAAPQPLTAQS